MIKNILKKNLKILFLFQHIKEKNKKLIFLKNIIKI
jgi:hypothetical protein